MYPWVYIFLNIMPLIVCTDLNERVLVCADYAGKENDIEYNALYIYIPSHQGNLVYDVCICVCLYVYTHIHIHIHM
jgi:hypothetical protein